jgi:hypothetical protein
MDGAFVQTNSTHVYLALESNLQTLIARFPLPDQYVWRLVGFLEPGLETESDVKNTHEKKQ